MSNDLKKYAYEIASLSVFSNIKKDRVLSSLLNFINCGDDDTLGKISTYSEFVNALHQRGGDLGIYLKRAVLNDENEYIKRFASGEVVSEDLEKNTFSELSLFSELSHISSDTLRNDVSYSGYLPEFCSTELDFLSEYKARLSNIHKEGYGIFAEYNMFSADALGNLVPVETADSVTMDTLIGYENERKKVMDNTLALIKNKPAANVLLCGDAGTGKSSTVKAVANFYRKDGIRLIELQKEQLILLPKVMEKIKLNPLKFIIFVDDLAFNKAEKGFGTLKAILEGSAAAKSVNSVIYATSNRRHLVKETFSDRSGDDVHINDTIQELMSLSERFGLTVQYSKPSKDLYLKIAKELAKRNNLTFDEKEFEIKAEAFALKKGGRSARVARQFVDGIISAE